MDSEYLVTLLVVVPLALQPDWNNRVRNEDVNAEIIVLAQLAQCASESYTTKRQTRIVLAKMKIPLYIECLDS